MAQQPVAPGWLREAAQAAAGDIETPAEPQELHQQAEEEEEQGEEEHRHSIQAERGLLHSQEVQQVFCDGQHPEGTDGMRGSVKVGVILWPCVYHTQDDLWIQAACTWHTVGAQYTGVPDPKDTSQPSPSSDLQLASQTNAPVPCPHALSLDVAGHPS